MVSKSVILFQARYLGVQPVAFYCGKLCLCQFDLAIPQFNLWHLESEYYGSISDLGG